MSILVEGRAFFVDTLVVVSLGVQVTVFGRGTVPAASDILALRMSPPRWRVFEVHDSDVGWHAKAEPAPEDNVVQFRPRARSGPQPVLPPPYRSPLSR